MKRLPRRVCLLGGLLRTLYYRRVDILGTPYRDRPTLYLLSHRNGAIDGIVYQKALGDTPSLISVQLLRGPLRLLFAGIPVVRDKDRARYGIQADAVAAPVAAAIAQLRAGGSLALYPEGTSDWGYRPLPYHSGMAVIVAQLLAAGADFVVQPAAAYYSKPDGFRSRVSLIFGAPFVPQGESIAALQKELAASLDAVSVHCTDAAQFNQAQRAAWQAAQRGEDYGVAFLRAQRANHPANIGCASAHRPLTTELPPHAPPITAASATDIPPDRGEGGGCEAVVAKTTPALGHVCNLNFPPLRSGGGTGRGCENRVASAFKTKCKQALATLALCLTCPLIVAGACLAARAADGRNNTSFFRILGGMAGALLQIPLWLAALYLAPLAGGLWLAAAALTWRTYPEPAPLPLPETP